MVMPTMKTAPHAYFLLGRQNQFWNFLKMIYSRALFRLRERVRPTRSSQRIWDLPKDI